MASAGYHPSVPAPHDPAHLSRGYGDTGPLSNAEAGRFEEKLMSSSVLGDGDMSLPARSPSRASTLNQGTVPSRSGTLKKRNSVKRSGSRRSLRAGSIRGVEGDDGGSAAGAVHNSVFYTPVPTAGSPTDILAARFQAWRKLLKDLIAYFREVAASYEHRSKALLKVSNVVNNTNAPPVFLVDGGLNDANRILRDFHKQAVTEAAKAKDIELDVVGQLSGLRADLAQKIKEIKSLSGDFKNSVEKEKEATRKCVAALEESLALVDSDPAAIAGRGDPFVVRLAVDRQVERQIDEENYLHRAYLNLENSGRELESIVVGEIQKAYNALAAILKREADESCSTIDRLRSGPLAMPRDWEWNEFVTNDPHFVNPSLPLRRLEDIEYPGRHHPAAAEVRAGMLERKSKYLKSYTPGWYVLSPTHLHEFKSADRIYTQPPVMSLLLSDQKLGSRSQPGSSSHKFVIKGRQTGSMHRGHTWVFRAETYDTMLAWYSDISNLIEKTGDERNAFVRRHARSVSAGSARSVSSDGGLEEDEADQVPFSAQQSMLSQPTHEAEPAPRPSPGGRFPSDLQVNRGLQAPLGPSSGSSSEVGNDLTTTAGGLQTAPPVHEYDSNYYSQHQQFQNYQQPQPTQQPFGQDGYGHSPEDAYQRSVPDPVSLQQQTSYYTNNPPRNPVQNDGQHPVKFAQGQPQIPSSPPQQSVPLPETSAEKHSSSYGDWMVPAAGGAVLGASGVGASAHQQQAKSLQQERPAHSQANQVFSTQPSPGPQHHPHHTAISAGDPSPAVPIPVPLESKKADADNQPFLGVAEAAPPVAASEMAMSGGPTITGVKRQNTDFSVSDLHVPGEYPKASKA